MNSQLSRSLLPLPTHQNNMADLVIEVVGKADAVNIPIGTKIIEENPVTVEIAAANIETLGDTVLPTTCWPSIPLSVLKRPWPATALPCACAPLKESKHELV